MSQDSDTQTTRNGRVTIRTVAEHAGVSVAAVSKVMRDAYGVSADMRARVEASIATLNYRPSAAARGMRGKTYTIGVIMADIKNPFFPVIIDGVYDGLNGTKYVPLVGIGLGSVALETTLVNALIDRQVDGIIMIGQRLQTASLEVISREVPVVVIGHHHPDATSFDTANNDDERGGALVVEHLLAQGYKRPAMLTLSRPDLGSSDVSRRREIGFSAAMRAAGFAPEMIRIAPAHDGIDDVTATVKALLDSADPPDAIYGWADYYALEVLSAVRSLGLRTPEDIGVIGYDNSEPCSFTQNDLTSIDQSGREIGRQSVRLLLERIGGRTTAEHFVTAPSVDQRGSTARLK